VGVQLEVLGTATPTVIGDRTVVVHMPRLMSYDGPALIQPAVLDELVTEPEYSDDSHPESDERPDSPWGYATSWGMSSETTALAITQIVISEPSARIDEVSRWQDTIMTSFPAWFAVLRGWCEVVANQDLDHVAPRRRLWIEGDGWAFWNDGKSLEPSHGRIHVDFGFGDPLDHHRWARFLDLAADRTAPPVEHLLLAAARGAHARDEFRRAVVDASTAIEIGLNRLLLQTHRETPSPLGDELVKRSKKWTLGNLEQVVRAARGLPSSVAHNLVELRNDVVHKTAREPTREESEAMLAAATDVLVLASPTD
jgi:hypothetical protein